MASLQDGKSESATGKSHVAPKVPRTRSPNFPAFSLRKAVEKADALHKVTKKYKVDMAAALKHMGYTSTSSSSALRAIGALEAYGLIETEGSGDARKVGVSEAGARIVMGHPERDALVKKAALLPSLFTEVWGMQTDDGIPPDDAIRNHLLWELKFNDSTIPDFIANFRDTLAYAGLSANDKIASVKGVRLDKPARTLWDKDRDPSSNGFMVGELVQWTISDVEQFPEPRPIKGFHNADHAYFEDDGTGIAHVKELKKVDTKTSSQSPFQSSSKPQDEAERIVLVEERFTLDEGPVTIRWPGKLSADSVADLEHFLDGMLKRAKRKAGVPLDLKPSGDNPSTK